jgi:hypothetical protein|tara:strand:- start:34 stop:348 length:315 start_codon:yes stop_codon:yes gene_type:complete
MSLKKDIISKALLNTNPGLEYRFYSGDIDTLEWLDKTKNHTSIDIIKEEIKRLQAEYDAKKYQRDRLQEYPSIQELVVALYDADDKAGLEAKRAEVKAKYPKPE